MSTFFGVFVMLRVCLAEPVHNSTTDQFELFLFVVSAHASTEESA